MGNLLSQTDLFEMAAKLTLIKVGPIFVYPYALFITVVNLNIYPLRISSRVNLFTIYRPLNGY